MIYRKKSDLEVSPIENCMGGQGTVKMEKLLHGPEEMLGKGLCAPYLKSGRIHWNAQT